MDAGEWAGGGLTPGARQQTRPATAGTLRLRRRRPPGPARPAPAAGPSRPYSLPQWSFPSVMTPTPPPHSPHPTPLRPAHPHTHPPTRLAANLLKPMLARGELRLIGATTLNEYREHVEKDAAFERRFQQVRSQACPPAASVCACFDVALVLRQHASAVVGATSPLCHNLPYSSAWCRPCRRRPSPAARPAFTEPTCLPCLLARPRP